jgi:hypothetical protein
VLRYGRATAQASIRRLPTAAARVRAQVRSCGICGGQSDIGAVFFRVLQFPLPILILPTAPHSTFISSGAVTIGSFVADVASGISLPPPQKKTSVEIRQTEICFFVLRLYGRLDKLLEPSVGVFLVWLCSPILGPCSFLYACLQAFTSYQPQPHRHSLYVSFVQVTAGTTTTTISFLTIERSGEKEIPRHRLAWHCVAWPWGQRSRPIKDPLPRQASCLPFSLH